MTTLCSDQYVDDQRCGYSVEGNKTRVYLTSITRSNHIIHTIGFPVFDNERNLDNGRFHNFDIDHFDNRTTIEFSLLRKRADLILQLETIVEWLTDNADVWNLQINRYDLHLDINVFCDMEAATLLRLSI